MKNTLLSLMLISYLVPILYVYFHCKESPSVSHVISKNECQQAIMLGMISMGIFTILYEINRKDIYSLLWIMCVLVGIYGVIFINENNQLHYLFASLVFFGILGFMRHHYRRKKCNILYTLLIIELLLLPVLMNCQYFFVAEILLILNFAVFYLCIHKEI